MLEHRQWRLRDRMRCRRLPVLKVQRNKGHWRPSQALAKETRTEHEVARGWQTSPVPFSFSLRRPFLAGVRLTANSPHLAPDKP